MPETAERPKFLLLETIMDLLDKKTDQDKLKSALAESKKSLVEIRTNFESDNSELEPHVAEAVTQETEMVRKFFTDWENSFAAIEKYFRTGVEFDLIAAGEMVKRSSEGLNFALECYTNLALQAMGPTDIPRLNLLIRCVEEVKDGATNNKLEMIITDEYITVSAAQKELQFEKNIFKYPEQDEMIQAYQDLMDGITKIGFFTKDGDEKLLDEGIEMVAKAYPRVKELVPKVNYKRMIQAPTKSASANLLINMIVARRKGSINDQMFEDTVNESEAYYNKSKMMFDQLSANDSGYGKEITEAKKGLDLFLEAVRDCQAFLNSREGLFLEQAEKELKESAEILDKSAKFFEELADREGKTPCVRCGHYNQPERKTCSKCGAILPKAAATSQAASTFAVQEGGKFTAVDQNDDTVPENLQKMFMAVKQVKNGDITLEEFEDTIFWLQNIMEQHREAGMSPIPHVSIDNLPETEQELTGEILENTQAIKELFEEGYRDWEEGLDCFQEFIETNDQNLLNQGMQIMMEGNRKLNKLQRIAAELSLLIQEHAEEVQEQGVEEGQEE